MPIPFIDLQRWEPDFLKNWEEKVKVLTTKTQFIAGDEVKQLETTLQSYCDVPYAITCANGTDALQIALRAADIGPGDTVLLPDLTFWATFEAIVNVGANPVTVDIDPDDLQMDFKLFKKACEKWKPKAAILVHLYGWASQFLEEYRRFSKENNIFLLEDGAQSYGTIFKGESIYKKSKCSTLSFYPAKVLGGAGDGGAVLCEQEELAKKIRTLANHGREDHYEHSLVGWNSRLDSLQAGFLNLSHLYLEKRLSSRRESFAIYEKHLAQSKINVRPPVDFNSNGYLNVLSMNPESRKKTIEALKEKKIGYSITYPKPISEQKGALPFLKGKLENKIHAAKKISEGVLNLPLFPYMTKEELESIVSIF